MKLLLDENLPKKLKQDFAEYEVYTVSDKGWAGIKNGDLLKRLVAENFNALLTFDKNLQHQQNFLKYPIAIFVLNASANTYKVLTKLSNRIKIILANNDLPTGPIIVYED